ncbi:hypothetical protein [Bdellovibrio sp. KM01]|uniref:hypothetical protein n=1 Tax=Bdellovibrio sp. KM01 TaxID=2748865 RepID=UPI002102A356|nr:hypothetical protein [Bdellovibrio sp. KM01]
MNSAQHLILSLLLITGFSARAQENLDAAGVADDVPAPQQSLMKSAASKEFNKPLFFDQLDNGVLLPPLELEYDLTGQSGKVLKIGPVVLSEQTFNFSLMPLGKAHPQISRVLTPTEKNDEALIINWPLEMMSSGSLEMISRTGAVLWQHEISELEQKKWAAQLQSWRGALLAQKVSPAELTTTGLFGSSFAIPNFKNAGSPFGKLNEIFRFCLTQQVGRGYSRLCSQWYGNQKIENKVVLGKARVDATTPRVLLNNEESLPRQSVPTAAEGPTSFFAELATGESYEFMVQPNKLQLMDIADTARPGLLRIVGYDTRPLGRSVVLNPDQYLKITTLIGFESTIGDSRKFWAASLKKDDAKIYLPGQGGGIFKQRFELSVIPRRQARLYVHERTPTGTYNDNIRLFGRKLKEVTVSTDQNSVNVEKDEPSEFEWRFKATERGEINRSYLNLDYQGQKYRSYFEIYKGYPRELSARLSVAKSSADFVFMGELAYNQWFEDLFTWSNYWVSRQRWGISAKYFKSFNEIKVSTSGRTAPLDVLTVDLKYRFIPGLWNRDETLGMMASYQNVNFGVLTAPMVGGGLFWARSMPKLIDDVFNILPLFRYPKWVDVEFIYYAQSLDSNVTLNSSMSLNFHGKVLWTNNLFGEAGFGIKRYAFVDSVLNQKADLNTFYGTVGMGLSF